MAGFIDIAIPKGMSNKELAKTFAAYRLGSRAFRIDPDTEENPYGPYPMKNGSDLDWQLDDSNDFWLHIKEAGHATIVCRYSYQEERLRTMAELFNLTFFDRG
jgi:hypothetical protein